MKSILKINECSKRIECIVWGFILKILLIGDFSDQYDEGLKNISKKILVKLSEKNEVEIVNLQQFEFFRILKLLVYFNPEIIHYIPGTTVSSFFLLRILKLRWRKSVTVMSSLHPKAPVFLKNKVIKYIIKHLFKPHIILYQNKNCKFIDLCDKSVFFPNGVDIEKFSPVSREQKADLKIKYSLDPNKKIILHVGHIFQKRNLGVFQKIQQNFQEIQVLIIGSTYLNIDEKILSDLKKSGCEVKVGYIPHINEIYALADCYVFPVKWGDTINIPLSVLEAMSTNLPVITQNYPALMQYTECQGFKVVDRDEDFISALDDILLMLINGSTVNTRECILDNSWSKLITIIETEIYR